MNLALENHLRNLTCLESYNTTALNDIISHVGGYGTHIGFETIIYKLVHPFWSELCSQFVKSEVVTLPFMFQEKIKNPFYINNQLKIIGLFDIFIRPQLKFAKYHRDIIANDRGYSIPYLLLLLPRIISSLSVLLIRLITLVPMYLCNIFLNCKEFLSENEYSAFYQEFDKNRTTIIKDDGIFENQQHCIGLFNQAQDIGLLKRQPVDLKKEIAMFNAAIGFFGSEKQQKTKEIFQKVKLPQKTAA